MYLNGSADQVLPIEHVGIMFAPRPAPVLAESGLAGGMVAVRLDALEAVDGADGTVVLAPKGSGRPRAGDVVAWCALTAVAPAVLDDHGRLCADGFLPDHVRLGVLEAHLGDHPVVMPKPNDGRQLISLAQKLARDAERHALLSASLASQAAEAAVSLDFAVHPWAHGSSDGQA